MSKLAPLNAKIEYKENQRCKYVYKCYHATYTAKDEFEAYERVDKLIQGLKKFRTAKIYNVNESDNCLSIEYIPGHSLYEIISETNVDVLKKWQSLLITLFIKARNAKVHFDSDPSNLMCDDRTGDIVIIDPVCVDLDIDDFVMIVFMWALIKIMLRNRSFWRNKAIIKHWFNYYREYLQATGVDFREFNSQLVKYIDVVIGWNKEGNSVEGPMKRVMRYLLFIPIYTVIKWIFKWNIVHP